MGPTTMDFIKVLKGKHSLETDGTIRDTIATFMSQSCGIPKDMIDTRDIFDFTRDCVLDYARTCDDTLLVMRKLLSLPNQNEKDEPYMLSLIGVMASTLISTRVKNGDSYVNGFTEEGMKKRVKPSKSSVNFGNIVLD